MKNLTTRSGLLIIMLKFVRNAFKSIFASESKNNFNRLKNYIAS